ncbi:MAG: mechanosensitive ion channel family protein [Gammaproteobacteria bacterium]|nr:mechanosensitive ion channel family protein [Gammaproteobacteria bacterium]
MKIFISILIIAGYLLSTRLVSTAIERVGAVKQVNTYRIKYVVRTINLALGVLFIFFLLLFWGIQYSQLAVFLSSVFAVAGVALFAQWSILSNITASLIIFFSFPYRVGDRITVVDKDDDISGIVEEITLFHVIIRNGDRIITYPNTMILQKAVIKETGIPPSDSSTDS